jgi:hypothetical protein
MNKPSKTSDQKARKRDLLVLLANWWIDDAANVGDLRDPYEKAQKDPQKAEPPVIIEGFRRALIALNEIIRIYPQDASTISDGVWLQTSIEQNELELGRFRGHSPQWTDRVFAKIRFYEKSNRDNFFFYSALLDNFAAGIRNWPIESHVARNQALLTYRSLVNGAVRTAPRALKKFEVAFERAPSVAQKVLMLDEMVKHFNSFVAARARIGYFESADLVGAAKSAREARTKRGSVPKVVRFGGAFTSEQRAASQSFGATHFISHPKELSAWLEKPAHELRR